MNTIFNEINKQKLINHKKTQKYLKYILIFSILIDLTIYIVFESIEIAFANVDEIGEILILYFTKVYNIFTLDNINHNNYYVNDYISSL
jgi:hypothetical protein